MSNRPDSWMPLYVADYRADTTRFLTEQHGAYLLIIMDYWRNGPPPDDDVVLAQITGLTLGRWIAHRPVVAPKFQIKGGFWHHKRIDEELAKAQKKSDQARDAAFRRHGGKDDASGGANASADAEPPHDYIEHAGADANACAEQDAEGHAESMREGCSSPSPTQEVLPAPSESPSPKARGRRKTNGKIFHLPDWIPEHQWTAWVEARTKNKHPPTVFALELAVAKLEELRDLGHHPAAVLAQSAFNGWTDLYAPKA